MTSILLGVTGSIAAYKSADIANKLTKNGHKVTVVMTENAMEFIAPLTFSTLTKQQVYFDSFAEISEFDVEHIGLAKQADIFVIAPATANIIAKLASGIADDLLTTVIMAGNGKPVLICPAMNTAMYKNPIVQSNIDKLQDFGYYFEKPRASTLACGDIGDGALADTDTIIQTIESHI